MPGVSHSFTSRREKKSSKWPQKLSHCAFENENVSVTPEVGRYWWRRAEGALSEVMVERSPHREGSGGTGGYGNLAVMRRWEL